MNDDLYIEDVIAHYGVLGMKWGVRRSRQKLDRLTRRAKDQQAKRTEVRSTKGIGSKAYAKSSKELNLTRARLDLQKAKIEEMLPEKFLLKIGLKMLSW